MPQNKFSINFAERLHGANEEDGFYHPFVALLPVGKVTGEFWRGAQKLHFDDDVYHRFLPNVRVGISERWEEKLTLKPHFEGEEISLLPRWNHALEQAVSVREGWVPFDSQRTNCLSGAIAVFEAMGFDFSDDFTRAAVGYKPNSFPVFEPFAFNANNPKHTALKAMRAHNEELVVRLKP